jgi:HEAT repeat protein
MAVAEQLKSLIDRMPTPDGRGMYTENIDKAKTEWAIARIYQGGRENILALIALLDTPGSAEDAKPHYALHSVLNHTLIVRDKKARLEFCDVLAESLGGELSTYNKSYLCQELQWAGGKEVAPALGKLLLDEELVEPAAMALVAIRIGAAQQFIAALPKAKGKCRLNIVHGLAALGHCQTCSNLLEVLDDLDPEVRIAAGAGLAKAGNSVAVDAMIKAADVAPGWERIQATKNCLALAEMRLAAGSKDDAKKIYTHLRNTRTDPSEAYIREAAERALAAVR